MRSADAIEEKFTPPPLEAAICGCTHLNVIPGRRRAGCHCAGDEEERVIVRS